MESILDKILKFEITVPALVGMLTIVYSFIWRSVDLDFRFIIHYFLETSF